ncbi:MAG TPA: energy transducer TonB [Pyrinomonadaceae bacterium]|nr:energy transducer TonB [Pyrinomonadaceae bacterium]
MFRLKACLLIVVALVLLAARAGETRAVRQNSQAEQQRQPVVISSVTPEYPPGAAQARAGGEVIVELKIDAEGRATAARVVEGLETLNEAAREAAMRWRFGAVLDKTSVRDVRLTFFFDRWSVAAQSEHVRAAASPFYVVVNPPAPPDTVDHTPTDAENKTCEVHQIKLERDKVGILYGLRMLEAEPDDAPQRLFPNASTEVEGGCVITDDSPKYALVLYCRECRKAKRTWELERQKRATAQSND